MLDTAEVAVDLAQVERGDMIPAAGESVVGEQHMDNERPVELEIADPRLEAAVHSQNSPMVMVNEHNGLPEVVGDHILAVEDEEVAVGLAEEYGARHLGAQRSFQTPCCDRRPAVRAAPSAVP